MKAGGVAAGLLAVPLLVIVIALGGADDCTRSAGTLAAASTGVDVSDAGLSSDAAVRAQQVANAGAVMDAAVELGLPVRAQQVGVMTALGESSLINLDHGDESAGVTNPDGSPTCSVGIFQQQWCLGGYGTREQAMDPTYAATTFFTRLQGVDGWQDLNPSTAAHKVQRNADPNHYTKYWDNAVRIVQALSGSTAAGQCVEAGPSTGAGAGPTGWGGHSNGQIPDAALAPIPWAPGHRARADAVRALTDLNNAYRAQLGRDVAITDSYRDYAAQVRTKAAKGYLAATPGTSNHGWALALDLGGGIESFNTVQHAWMVQHAPAYGWVQPSWAQPGGSKPEPWHWEYVGSTS